MFCAVVGEKYIWLFTARNKTESRKTANTILFFEKLGSNTVLSGFSSESGYWKAEPKQLNSNIKELIEKTDKTKIIKIKKKRAPTIDVLYVTRLQKERQ